MTEIPQDEIRAAAERVLLNEPQPKPKQQVVMTKGDTVQLDRHIQRSQDIMGGEEVARLEISGQGAAEDAVHTETLALIHAWDESNDDYQNLVRLAQQNNINTSNLVLFRFGDKGNTAATFLSPGKVYTVGREGNVKWLPYGLFFVEEDWTPFGDNQAISTEEFTISPTDDGVVMHQLSDSSVKLTSAAIRQSTAEVSSV
jgi:hypothetical protein